MFVKVSKNNKLTHAENEIWRRIFHGCNQIEVNMQLEWVRTQQVKEHIFAPAMKPRNGHNIILALWSGRKGHTNRLFMNVPKST